jgi:Mg2+ and Co2+ transporter CorA
LNAYELADEAKRQSQLIYLATEERVAEQLSTMFTNYANMLRQQADKIAELEGEVSHLKHINKNWSISEGWALQRVAELEKTNQEMSDLYEKEIDKRADRIAELEKQVVIWEKAAMDARINGAIPKGTQYTKEQEEMMLHIWKGLQPHLFKDEK